MMTSDGLIVPHLNTERDRETPDRLEYRCGPTLAAIPDVAGVHPPIFRRPNAPMHRAP
jgi:hypothetical protein